VARGDSPRFKSPEPVAGAPVGGMSGEQEAPFPSLSELERLASERLAEPIRAYINGGAGDERTIAANRESFRRWAIRPRVWCDVATVDLGTYLLGSHVDAPFFIAPTAYHGQVHPDAEPGTARAATAAGVLSVFSTLSSASIEAIAHASGAGLRWFQLYLQPDFEVNRSLVERAGRAGYSAIVVTADVPVLAVRDRQATGGFAIDASVPIGNGAEVQTPARTPVREGAAYRLPAPAGESWEVLDRLREVTKLPLVVKGVLTAEDARLAVDHGAQGVVVSNHGGRQLDGARTSLQALPEIVRAVGDRTEVYLDGGVRHASDILIALALGARAVGIGRPVLWALALGGSGGVARYLDLVGTELASAMALAGRRSIAEIDRSLIEAVSPVGP
jgi:4-hydroxymandelate oxidase